MKYVDNSVVDLTPKRVWAMSKHAEPIINALRVQSKTQVVTSSIFSRVTDEEGKERGRERDKRVRKTN